MYADVEIICDGALESRTRFHDEIAMTAFLDLEREFAEADGMPIEIYVQFHEHSDEDVAIEDCSCIQYATDGRPKYVFNMGERKGAWQ